jgi:hypothetical protein
MMVFGRKTELCRCFNPLLNPSRYERVNDEREKARIFLGVVIP